MGENNLGYVARVISDYRIMLDDKIINECLMNSLYYQDCKMFLSILNESKKICEDVVIKPNIITYVKQLSQQKGGEKFSDLLNKFE